MTRDLVSVVVTTFNGERYLQATLESALGQTYAPVEIIVVDDGSTDGTAAILASFSERIRVIRQENQGHGSARRRGVDAATGEFIAFLDHDDIWLPAKLARQVATFREHPETVFVHTARELIDARGHPIPEIQPRHPCEGRCLVQLAGENFVTDSSVMVRRDALDAGMLVGNPEWCADWDLYLQLAATGPLRYVPDRLTRYRVHEDAMSQQTSLAMFEAALQVIDRLIARVPDEEVHRAARRHRHWIEMEIAHAHYERGDFAEARQIFRRIGTPRRPKDWTRYISSMLPSWLRKPARRAYQRIIR